MTAMLVQPDETNHENNPHETLHAGVEASIDRYVDLSQAYAADGRPRLALLATWVADVQILQCMLWESGLGSAPDPDAQLAAVGQAVQGALAEYVDRARESSSPRAVVEGAREALTAVFDESVHAQLRERFGPLDHLDGLMVPAGSADSARLTRLDGRTAAELVQDLRVAAADCMAVAAAMRASDDVAEALSQTRMADLASFEAYLIEAAIEVGDTTLATVDLRWDLGTTAVAEVDGLSADPCEAVDRIRAALVYAVGPAEQGRLLAAFEPVWTTA